MLADDRLGSRTTVENQVTTSTVWSCSTGSPVAAASTGTPVLRASDGIGDVALVADGASREPRRQTRVSAHRRRGVRWRNRPATPTVVDDALYAYPNHVHAADDGVVFVTGNTYRRTAARPTAVTPTSTPQSACPRMAIGGGTPTSAGSRR